MSLDKTRPSDQQKYLPLVLPRPSGLLSVMPLDKTRPSDQQSDIPYD